MTSNGACDHFDNLHRLVMEESAMIKPVSDKLVLTPVMAPEFAAFAELQTKGVFDKNLPGSMNGNNWLTAPVTALKGIGKATAALMAARNIDTVRDLAKFLPNVGSPSQQKVIASLRDEVIAACKKYGVKYEPTAYYTTMQYIFDPVTGRGYSR